MKSSIVEFAPMDLDSGKTAEQKISLTADALISLRRELIYILSDLEERIETLENK